MQDQEGVQHQEEGAKKKAESEAEATQEKSLAILLLLSLPHHQLLKHCRRATWLCVCPPQKRTR